tara:strand:+ start:66 stop:737 length:672 start_codon:yes stop_codon:yes gene_type:complete
MENNAIKNPIFEKDSYQLRNITELKAHPKNYKKHPDDQLKHLCKSIEENGLYRHIVLANDDTILAGHGVVLACQKLNIVQVPTIKLPIDSSSPKAIKLLTADNEVGHLAISDDRQLSDILKEILDDGDLLGTGYDEMMLSNLLYVTRPESEIKTLDEAKEWVGLPEYEKSKIPLKMTVSFQTEEDRREFARVLSIPITDKTKSTWFPYKENDDMKSVEFSDEE